MPFLTIKIVLYAILSNTDDIFDMFVQTPTISLMVALRTLLSMNLSEPITYDLNEVNVSRFPPNSNCKKVDLSV